MKFLDDPTAFVVAQGCFVGWLDFMPRKLPTVAIEDTPLVYQELAMMPDGALRSLPFGLRDGYRMTGKEPTAAMFLQTIHRKPIVGGMLARIPDKMFDDYLKLPGIGDLLRMQDGVREQLRTTPLTEGELEHLSIRYLLVSPEVRGAAEERYLDLLFAQAAREE